MKTENIMLKVQPYDRGAENVKATTMADLNSQALEEIDRDVRSRRKAYRNSPKVAARAAKKGE